MHRPKRWAIVTAMTVAAAGAAGVALAAGPADASPAGSRALTYYAFDINNGTNDPGLVPVPGSNPNAFAQGDELIINDQLTTTHRQAGGYPIVGYDSGVCTLTRLPEKDARQTFANCVVTAVWTNGSLTVQGAVPFRSQQPESAVLAITGGTGRFGTARGTMRVGFTKEFKVLSIAVK
ncbi:MAG: dirigent protein [Streptosporangiaceae bacterium]